MQHYSYFYKKISKPNFSIYFLLEQELVIDLNRKFYECDCFMRIYFNSNNFLIQTNKEINDNIISIFNDINELKQFFIHFLLMAGIPIRIQSMKVLSAGPGRNMAIPNTLSLFRIGNHWFSNITPERIQSR